MPCQSTSPRVTGTPWCQSTGRHAWATLASCVPEAEGQTAVPCSFSSKVRMLSPKLSAQLQPGCAAKITTVTHSPTPTKVASCGNNQAAWVRAQKSVLSNCESCTTRHATTRLQGCKEEGWYVLSNGANAGAWLALVGVSTGALPEHAAWSLCGRACKVKDCFCSTQCQSHQHMCFSCMDWRLVCMLLNSVQSS
jgi:hypothetical protein